MTGPALRLLSLATQLPVADPFDIIFFIHAIRIAAGDAPGTRVIHVTPAVRIISVALFTYFFEPPHLVHVVVIISIASL